MEHLGMKEKNRERETTKVHFLFSNDLSCVYV